ncbi:MAG: flagellar basal body rod protein FlgB [Rhodocyclaceae bacterium]
MHEGHGGAPGNTDNGTFSKALAQAIAQKANHHGASHGAHGDQVAGIAPSTASAHPNHFSIGKGGHAGHNLQQKMLGVRAYRQQLLASNIANADTPGYKAVDIDSEEAAQVVKGASASLPLATTAADHQPGGPQAPPFPLKYHVPNQAAADGNTVEMDGERRKFSENSLMYQFSLDRVSGHFKHFTELLQNLK